LKEIGARAFCAALLMCANGLFASTAQPCPEFGPAVSVKFMKSNSAGTDVVLKKGSEPEEVVFHLASDVSTGRPPVHINGFIFYFDRVNEGTDKWNDRLWRLGPDKTSHLVAVGRGLHFAATPDAKFIVLARGTAKSKFGSEELLLIDSELNLMRSFHLADLKKSVPVESEVFGDDLWPLGCSNETCWIAIEIAEDLGSMSAFIKLDLKSLATNGYPAKVYPDNDQAFDPNLGRFIYSNYPFHFEREDRVKFDSENHLIQLKAYDIVSGNIEELSFSNSKEFDPKFLNPELIQISSPRGNGKICLSLPKSDGLKPNMPLK